MRETKVAHRYAKALFELSIEMKLLEQVHEDIRLFLQVCRQNRDFVLMLKSPVIHDKKKQAILRSVFEKKVHELSIRFLNVITHNRREYILPVIAEEFIHIYQKHHNILPTTLTTAVKLDAETRDSITGLLSDRAAATIELTEEVSEEIIGGFILEFENMQYDASVLRRIKNLQKEFDVNLYIKGF